MTLTRNIVEMGINSFSEWDLLNKCLYDLCLNHPKHTNPKIILAKTAMIGRTYSATIERRKKVKVVQNEDFFIVRVLPVFKSMKLDPLIARLKELDSINLSNIRDVLSLHKLLVDNLFVITGLRKRSFVSKYLHFHLPNLYIMFDSICEKAARTLHKDMFGGTFQYNTSPENEDPIYGKYIRSCMKIIDRIKLDQNIDFYKLDCGLRKFDKFMQYYGQNYPK